MSQDSIQGGGRRPKEVTGRVVFTCLITFFAIVAGVNAIMIHAAVSTFGGVETESSYRAGLAFARETAIAQAQADLHWQVSAEVSRVDGVTVIEVTAQDAGGRPIQDIGATVVLSHPEDRRADIEVELRATQPGVFRARAVAVAGQRDLVIELSRGGERLFRSKNRVLLQ